MTAISLYFLSMPVGLAAIFFAYRASLEGTGAASAPSGSRAPTVC